MAEKSVVRQVKIAGHPFVLRSSDVVRAVRGIDPEPIASHYVVVGTRRFPPKQVLSELTGLDRADFTTHQARRTLIGLGFSAGRRPAKTSGLSSASVRRQADGPERLADCEVQLPRTSRSGHGRLAVGGAVVRARMAEVSLHIGEHSDTYTWTAPVWFCDPWAPSFGLLGLRGFFDQFEVTIASYDEWFELTPAKRARSGGVQA
jgi:hypothetical protein